MIDNLNKKSSANKTGAGKIKFGGMNGGDHPRFCVTAI